jgi:hypothetical protein
MQGNFRGRLVRRLLLASSSLFRLASRLFICLAPGSSLRLALGLLLRSISWLLFGYALGLFFRLSPSLLFGGLTARLLFDLASGLFLRVPARLLYRDQARALLGFATRLRLGDPTPLLFTLARGLCIDDTFGQQLGLVGVDRVPLGQRFPRLGEAGVRNGRGPLVPRFPQGLPQHVLIVSGKTSDGKLGEPSLSGSGFAASVEPRLEGAPQQLAGHVARAPRDGLGLLADDADDLPAPVAVAARVCLRLADRRALIPPPPPTTEERKEPSQHAASVAESRDGA